MKKIAFLIGLVVCNLLLSCTDNFEGVPDVKLLPTKEIHYNFETGEKIGERTFTYDQGRLIREYYTNVGPFEFIQEIKYEYDNDGNLVKKMTIDPTTDGKYFVEEFTYENGLKKSETMSFDGNPTGYRTIYFYSGARADSSEISYYSTIDGKYIYNMTTLYECDARDRIVKAFQKDWDGATTYSYQNNNLLETCTEVPGDQGVVFKDCVVNEYNSDGELVTISEVSSWGSNKLKEELFYQDGFLNEKKVYSFPAYQPGNTLDIKLIRYEY